MKTKYLSLFVLIILVIMGWLTCGIIWGFQFSLQNTARWIGLAIACCLFGSALVLAAIRWNANLWIFAGLLTLLFLLLPISNILKIFPARDAEPFGSLEALTLFLIPSVALIVAALLLYSGLGIYKKWQDAKHLENAEALKDKDTNTLRNQAGKLAAILILGTILIAKAFHNFYWLTVWDNTTDPLGYIWLVFPIFAAFFSGLLLSILLPTGQKWVGIGYALLISALMISVSADAQRADIRVLTEKRAERVSQALESYYAREGTYPQDLQQLIPRDILSLPEPMIIFGQAWCYDAGADYYRLGYIYRLDWSDPRLIGRIYKAEGQMPDLPLACEHEVAAIKERDPHYPYSYWKEEEK